MPVMELSKGLSLPHSFAECEGVEEESALGNPHQGGSTMKRVSECKRVLVTEKLLEFGFKLDVDSDEGKVRQVIDGIDGGQVNFYEVSSDSMSETSSIDSSVSACLYVSDTASLMVPDSFDGLKPLFGDNEGVPPASPSVNFSKVCSFNEIYSLHGPDHLGHYLDNKCSGSSSSGMGSVGSNPVAVNDVLPAFFFLFFQNC